METRLVVPQKAENRTTTSPNNFTPYYVPKRTLFNGYSNQNLCYRDFPGGTVLPRLCASNARDTVLVSGQGIKILLAICCEVWAKKKHHIHSSFGHNSQKVAVSQSPSMDEWINKRRYIHVQYIIIQP